MPRCFVGFFRGEDSLIQKLSEIKMLILAGGFGTRLKSAVPSLPKPLAPVHGKPFIELLLKNYYRQGLRQFILSLHFEAEKIIETAQALLNSGELPEATIDYVVESEPLGTGGAILFSIRELGLKDSFLVTNSDTWLTDGIAQMCVSEAPAMGLVRVEENTRYGSVNIENDRITSFVEKDDQENNDLINAGLYLLDPSDLLVEMNNKFSLERDFFPKIIRAKKITPVILRTEFVDIGVPDDYYKFCSWVEANKGGLF